ncbi:hypothetical protein [Agromyces aureus]|uniref:Uncharacterized protein n=1 Tax=Agromyces aureus TaxID=453304 RepID=A0A191WB14_9MICO|nr:hypothetical protein [Agromyces aureus]ANJ25427.1 hypothetical protein ATC03_00210 [Agromyces aureus]
MLIAVVAVLTLAGCSQLPPFESARDEARGEMQNVIDLLPDGSVDHVEDPIPAGFVSCGDGKQYTGRWLVHLNEPTDAAEAVRELRLRVGPAGFVEDEDLANQDDRFGVRREGADDAPLIGISVDEDLDGTPYVQVLAFARCSQAPEGTD